MTVLRRSELVALDGTGRFSMASDRDWDFLGLGRFCGCTEAAARVGSSVSHWVRVVQHVMYHQCPLMTGNCGQMGQLNLQGQLPRITH